MRTCNPRQSIYTVTPKDKKTSTQVQEQGLSPTGDKILPESYISDPDLAKIVKVWPGLPEHIGVLSQGLTKAVESLVGLLDNKDNRLKRLAAKDVIDFIIRHKENEDLDERLTAIEQRLSEQKRH